MSAAEASSKAASGASNGEAQFRAKYELGKQLGAGAFGTVHKANSLETGKSYAVKLINKEHVGTLEIQRLRQEAQIMQTLIHPNIIKFEGYFESESKLLIVMDLASGGELLTMIAERDRFSEAEASCIVGNLLDAVSYMHRQNVIHRDLKPENILMTDSTDMNAIKVADFGLSKSFRRGDEPEDMRMTQFCGTMSFMAPELFADQPLYSKAVDVWSCGVITYLLLTGRHPFPSEKPEMLRREISAGLPPWPSDCTLSNEARDFLARLLKVDPLLRFSAEEALVHPWITGAPEGELQPTVLEMMRAFAAERRLKRIARTVMAATTLQRHVTSIQSLFRDHISRYKAQEDKRRRTEALEGTKAPKSPSSDVKSRVPDQRLHALIGLRISTITKAHTWFRKEDLPMSLGKDVFARLFATLRGGGPPKAGAPARANGAAGAHSEEAARVFAAVAEAAKTRRRVDAFTVFAASTLFARGSLEQRLRLCFSLFDFNDDRRLNREEMTMLMMTCERANAIMCGGVLPDVTETEALTEAAFAAADTDSSDDLTVLEFLKWAAESKSAGGYVSNLRTFLTQDDYDLVSDAQSQGSRSQERGQASRASQGGPHSRVMGASRGAQSNSQRSHTEAHSPKARGRGHARLAPTPSQFLQSGSPTSGAQGAGGSRRQVPRDAEGSTRSTRRVSAAPRSPAADASPTPGYMRGTAASHRRPDGTRGTHIADDPDAAAAAAAIAHQRRQRRKGAT